MRRAVPAPLARRGDMTAKPFSPGLSRLNRPAYRDPADKSIA
jgi:hypothetical protein